MVVGGQAPKAIRSVEGFDFKKERWVSLHIENGKLIMDWIYPNLQPL